MPFIFALQKFQLFLKHFYFFIFSVLFLMNMAHAQQADSLPVQQVDSAINIIQADSAGILKTDSIITRDTVTVKKVNALDSLLTNNKYLNSKGKPESMAVQTKKRNYQVPLFYLLAGLVFLFGVFKSVYSRYFATLFRVFFNSSLRQSQLTDQLLQAKLPSLFFNFIFLASSAVYVYILFQRYQYFGEEFSWYLLGVCVTVITAIYLFKYIVLKFVGWLTGHSTEADTYIFVVFLINKIIGICLLPVIIVLSFSIYPVTYVFELVSFIIIGVLFLLRYIRSYSLLQSKLKVSRFHFLLFIFSFEILPILLIYKATAVFIIKNL